MQLSRLLHTQGFGTRRECAGLIAAGLVALDDGVCADPNREVEPCGLRFRVRGEEWPYHEKALVVLHKPAGYECSRRPSHHPSVLVLLPPPLRLRGLQPVGRLDADTTGLLLLTDDGALIHRLTSPKRHVAKVYEVETVDPVTPAQIDALRRGVVLHDDPAPVRAAACEETGERGLRLTLLEGKYHQVKRMLAAVGNTVARLHRSRFGDLTLPSDLAAGRWRWLDGLPVVVVEDSTAHLLNSPN
jgi:16S rRNA pseudouridine516 synthase